jgi:hypothetical protein
MNLLLRTTKNSELLRCTALCGLIKTPTFQARDRERSLRCVVEKRARRMVRQNASGPA